MALIKENIEVAENYLKKLLPEAEDDKALIDVFCNDATLIGRAYASLGLENDAYRMFRLALELQPNGRGNVTAENFVRKYLHMPLNVAEASYFGRH